jgi:bifunctional ADP-heptose synthase (sugar kinase/adenylyltransferase)
MKYGNGGPCCTPNFFKPFRETTLDAFEAANTGPTACAGRRKQTVLANGCFDILHVGHLRYLEEGAPAWGRTRSCY